MNGRMAKKFRSVVYGGPGYAKSEEVQYKRGPQGNLIATGKRRKYQDMKKKYKEVKRNG